MHAAEMLKEEFQDLFFRTKDDAGRTKLTRGLIYTEAHSSMQQHARKLL